MFLQRGDIGGVWGLFWGVREGKYFIRCLGEGDPVWFEYFGISEFSKWFFYGSKSRLYISYQTDFAYPE